MSIRSATTTTKTCMSTKKLKNKTRKEEKEVKDRDRDGDNKIIYTHGADNADDTSLSIELSVLQSIYPEINSIGSSISLDLIVTDLVLNRYAVRIEMEVPGNYPVSLPSISMKCGKLGKINMKKCNSYIVECVKKLKENDMMIVSLLDKFIDWFSNNIFEDDSPVMPQIVFEVPIFRREYIWFHHIYYRPKRRSIISLANIYHLYGICLFGKPGIVIVEGLEKDILLYIQELRGMSWQKMSNKRYDRILCNTKEEFKSKFVFNTFTSLTDIDQPAAPSDLATLELEMRKVGLEEYFKEIVGIEE